jgi:hypothetical protein
VYNLKIRAANARQGPAALTNKKQDNLDQIHVGNLENGSAVRNYYHKKYFNKFWKQSIGKIQ